MNLFDKLKNEYKQLDNNLDKKVLKITETEQFLHNLQVVIPFTFEVKGIDNFKLSWEKNPTSKKMHFRLLYIPSKEEIESGTSKIKPVTETKWENRVKVCKYIDDFLKSFLEYIKSKNNELLEKDK